MFLLDSADGHRSIGGVERLIQTKNRRLGVIRNYFIYKISFKKELDVAAITEHSK